MSGAGVGAGAAPWEFEGSLWTWVFPGGLGDVPVDLQLPLAVISPFQVGVLQYGERLVQEWALGQHPTAQSLLEAARNLTRQEGRETRTAMAIRQAWWALEWEWGQDWGWEWGQN